MIDSILAELKEKVGDSLTSKFGLNSDENTKALEITENTIKDEISENSSGGLGGIMDMLQGDKLDDLTATIGKKLGVNLEKGLDIDALKAGKIKDVVMQLVSQLIKDKLGSSGGALGGIGSMLGGKIGKLF